MTHIHTQFVNSNNSGEKAWSKEQAIHGSAHLWEGSIMKGD